MRLVHLNCSKDHNPFDIIMRYGCGPHFVLNRLELFESMIKEQGTTFWFRFWLNFCYYPGCDDLEIISKAWPEMRDFVSTGIHALFVKGSIEAACQYSLNTIKLMRVTLPDLKTLLSSTSIATSKIRTSPPKRKQKKNTFFDALQSLFVKCTGVAFGANLCVLFYEWLAAVDADEGSQYHWNIPKKYLEPNFQPGELELFLANEWNDKLIWLLGVSYYEVPWLRRLLIGKPNSVIQLVKQKSINRRIYGHQEIKQVAKLLSIKRNEKRNAIQKVDERSNIYECDISKLKRRSVSSKSTLKGDSCSKVKSSHSISSRKEYKCARCYRILKRRYNPTTCERCVKEKWIEPRYYCNSFCRVQHWYQHHEKEHYDIRRNCSETSLSDSLPPSVTKTLT